MSDDEYEYDDIKGSSEAEPEEIHVDVSTYTAPLVALFIPQNLGCRILDIVSKEIVCILMWVLQMFVMRKLIGVSVHWQTRATANWQVKLCQVVAVMYITVNLSGKIETACDLLPAFCTHWKQDGMPHWALLLSSLNGALLVYFTLSIVYNAACGIAVAHMVVQCLGYIFTFGVVLSLDTLFANQALINGFWFSHVLEDSEGNALKDKDGKEITPPSAGAWDYTLGFADEEDDEDPDPEHLRINGNSAAEDPAPLCNPNLWKRCGPCAKKPTKKTPIVSMVMSQIIRLSPFIIIITVFTSVGESTFGYCRALTDPPLNLATLQAENRHAITSASDCAIAARLMMLSDHTVSGDEGICSFEASERRLYMTKTFDGTVDRILCQDRIVKIPIRSGEFVMAKYFGWWRKITVAREPVPLCSANNMFDIDDTAATGVPGATACDKALALLGLIKHPVNPSAPKAPGAFPNQRFAECLGKTSASAIAPMGVCMSTYDETVAQASVNAR